MQPKRSKYDTNPLDGNVAERADQDWGRDTGYARRSANPGHERRGDERNRPHLQRSRAQQS